MGEWDGYPGVESVGVWHRGVEAFPAEPRRAADCLQRPLCSRFRQQLTPGVRLHGVKRTKNRCGGIKTSPRFSHLGRMLSCTALPFSVLRHPRPPRRQPPSSTCSAQRWRSLPGWRAATSSSIVSGPRSTASTGCPNPRRRFLSSSRPLSLRLGQQPLGPPSPRRPLSRSCSRSWSIRSLPG